MLTMLRMHWIATVATETLVGFTHKQNAHTIYLQDLKSTHSIIGMTVLSDQCRQMSPGVEGKCICK